MPIPKATVVTADDGDVVYVYANTDGFSLGVPTMSATEAAKVLGITKGRVSQLIASGKLVAERFAGRTQVTVDSVEAYAASDRSAGRPKKMHRWHKSRLRLITTKHELYRHYTKAPALSDDSPCKGFCTLDSNR